MSEKATDVVVQNQEGNIVGFVNSNNKNIQKFQEQCNETLLNLFNDEQLVRKFISSVMLCFARNPKLNDCTGESLRNVLLACAEFKLFPSSVTGQCYIVPFKNKGVLEATFMLGYQGMITLAERAGVQMIDAQVVYEKDDFKCTLGTEPSITHNADVFNPDRGAPKGVYAIAILKSGHSRVFPMSMEDVYKHRAKSKSWQGEKKKYSPWHEDNDPQLTMPKKTAIRQLFKFIPKDDITSKALAMDTQGEYVRQMRVVNPQSLIEQNPTDMDIQAFVQEARDHFNTPPNEGCPHIEDALKEVTGGDSWNGITADQLAAVKKLIFTGEAPSDGETQGKML